MGWHLAPSLVQFRNEVNARWPRRPKGSDGTIGNASHAARASDHNPNDRGSVNAIDITYPGVNADQIIAAVKRHPAANYVIFNRRIWSRSHGWVARPYTGASPHTEHLHISILQTVEAEQSQTRWFGSVVKRSSWRLPRTHAYGPKVSTTVHNGTRNSEDAADVKRIQAKFKGCPVTGFYGSVTAGKVRAWQLRRLMPPTGRVGKREWDRLGL
jgi:hypothetical protein